MSKIFAIICLLLSLLFGVSHGGTIDRCRLEATAVETHQVCPMSTTGTFYSRAGFNLTLTPPRPGIYYTAVAVFNPSPFTFTVQNGVNQNTLSAYQAQLFSMPTSGASIVLNPPATSFTYGAWMGPIVAVWFDPEETPGSYPVVLQPSGGITQWTPPGGVGNAGGIGIYPALNYPTSPAFTSIFVPVGTLNSIVITMFLENDITFTAYGVQSGEEVGTVSYFGAETTGPLTIPINDSTYGDTSYYVLSSGPIVVQNVALGLG